MNIYFKHKQRKDLILTFTMNHLSEYKVYLTMADSTSIPSPWLVILINLTGKHFVRLEAFKVNGIWGLISVISSGVAITHAFHANYRRME